MTNPAPPTFFGFLFCGNIPEIPASVDLVPLFFRNLFFVFGVKMRAVLVSFRAEVAFGVMRWRNTSPSSYRLAPAGFVDSVFTPTAFQ